MKYRTVLLFGAPGSGKGTQGKVLGSIPGFYHCACGDIFRNLKVNSKLGRTFVDYSSKGQLVPDSATVELWTDFMEGVIQTGRFHPNENLLVLDGIPRNIPQAEILRDTIDVRAMFYLKIRNIDELVRRIQRRALRENRLDDMNLDVIRTRLETYEKETEPLVDFYGKKLVHRIDSDLTPSEVCERILSKIINLGIQPEI
jgi:adenylate kinase